MPELDKVETAIQWIGGFGLLIGSIIAGLFGVRAARRSSNDDNSEREVAEREERQKRYSLERKLDIAQLRADLEQVVRTSSDGINNKIDKLEDSLNSDIRSVAERVHVVEKDLAVLQRRPRQ